MGQSKPCEREFVRYMPSFFYPASISSAFSASSGHGQSPVTCIVPNTWILTTETILVLPTCS